MQQSEISFDFILTQVGNESSEKGQTPNRMVGLSQPTPPECGHLFFSGHSCILQDLDWSGGMHDTSVLTGRFCVLLCNVYLFYYFKKLKVLSIHINMPGLCIVAVITPCSLYLAPIW